MFLISQTLAELTHLDAIERFLSLIPGLTVDWCSLFYKSEVLIFLWDSSSVSETSPAKL